MQEGISCLCLTYARWNTLEEAIECFNRQTYTGMKELIVVNDCPEQQLVCDSPNVVIVNLPVRCQSLGEKYNVAVAVARYEHLAVWEDDDIFLPHRLEQTLAAFRAGAAYYNNTSGFYYQPPLLHTMNKAHFSAACWTRDLLHRAGYFKHTYANTDQDILLRLSKAVSSEQAGVSKEYVSAPLPEPYYIYRWGQGAVYHLSGAGTQQEAWEAAPNHARMNPYWRVGVIQLQPHWEEDYCEKVTCVQGKL